LPKRWRGMTGLNMSSRSPNPSRSMILPSSRSRPAIRKLSASSAPLTPWSILQTIPYPLRRPRIGAPKETNRPLISGPISPGSPASTSRKCLGYKPQRSISSSLRWASIGIHGRQTNILPPGWDAVLIIRSVAAKYSPRAVDGSKIAPVAPCAWPPKVSARAPALLGRFIAACAANSDRPKPRPPQPIHSPKLSIIC
jgi:hypothetical protein